MKENEKSSENEDCMVDSLAEGKIVSRQTSALDAQRQSIGQPVKGMSRKQYFWYYMLAFIFLVTMLAVGAKMKDSFWYPKMKIRGLFPDRGQTNGVIRAAEPAKAHEILTSVVNAAEIFSIRVGGGGDSLFPTNAFQMRENMPPLVAHSIEGCFSAPAVPLGGYVCQYVVDSARTNFLCKAIPANGYTGGVFAVRKDMAINRIGDKTCIATNPVPLKKNHTKMKIRGAYSNSSQTNSVIRAAEPAKAHEILTSVVNAAEIFSIRVGGGGDSLFPTNAFQMRENMPPLVAHSIEGCFSAPVVPLGGYVCQYVVDSARTNFLCKAIPANGYTGGVFAVRKDMAINRIGDKTCIATNPVPLKKNQ